MTRHRVPKLRRLSKERPQGQAMMEFVLVFPVVLLLVMGIIEFAFLNIAHQVVNYAAYTSARAAIVGGNTHMAAAVSCLAISPASVDKLNPGKVPGFDIVGDIAKYFTNIRWAAKRLVFAYFLSSVKVTHYDKEGKETGNSDDYDHLEARVTYYYALKFPLIGTLANYVLLNAPMSKWDPAYYERKIEAKEDVFMGPEFIKEHTEEWLEAEALKKATGVKFVPIIKVCTMGINKRG